MHLTLGSRTYSTCLLSQDPARALLLVPVLNKPFISLERGCHLLWSRAITTLCRDVGQFLS